MKPSKKLAIAACAALLMSGAQAADNHTINISATVADFCRFNAPSSNVNFTLDPSAATTVTQGATILYRCTKGTTPVFGLASASTGSGAAGTLGDAVSGDTIAYTYVSSAPVDGTGLGAFQDKTLSVDVSVNQANAANVTPGTYTDTIAITLNP